MPGILKIWMVQYIVHLSKHLICMQTTGNWFSEWFDSAYYHKLYFERDETEAEILANLKAERADKTTIIAAHRLSSVMNADEIIVLDAGHVVERGTHAQLMTQHGWYQKMFTRQQLETKVEGAVQ